MNRVAMALVFVVALLPLVTLRSAAVRSGWRYPSGISGHSGRDGRTCAPCHSSGPPPAVTISGPTTVTAGAAVAYTFTISPRPSAPCGFNVAADAGGFVAGPGSQVLDGEMTHTSPGAGSWTFGWRPPAVSAPTRVTLWGAGMNGRHGAGGSTTLLVTVLPHS